MEDIMNAQYEECWKACIRQSHELRLSYIRPVISSSTDLKLGCHIFSNPLSMPGLSKDLCPKSTLCWSWLIFSARADNCQKFCHLVV